VGLAEKLVATHRSYIQLPFSALFLGMCAFSMYRTDTGIMKNSNKSSSKYVTYAVFGLAHFLLIPAKTVAFFTTVSQLYLQILKAMTTVIHIMQQLVSSFSFGSFHYFL